jgi:predicted transglutaminase-like cysteine proteinase
MEQTARLLFRAGLAGLALLAATSPALAQVRPFAASDKSEAILGVPSALAAIMAAQSGNASVASALPLTYAVLRPAPLLTPAPFVPQAAPVIAASLDRPDVFNSLAMPIAHTPLDARWTKVQSARVGGSAARFAMGLRQRDERARLDAVNRFVNARVAFTDDSRQFGVADKWSAANSTLARGRGDCEDYAIAKLALLRRAGFADRDLYFVILKDLARRADHAVLVVRSGGRFLVLDNGTDRLTDSAEIRDYRPILTFSAGQRFAHGYRRSLEPQLIMASGSATRTPGEVTIATASGMPSSPFASR